MGGVKDECDASIRLPKLFLYTQFQPLYASPQLLTWSEHAVVVRRESMDITKKRRES